MGLSISRAPKQGQDAVPEDISISCLRHVPQTESCPNLRESAGRCRPGQSRTCSNTLSTSNYAFDCNCRDMFICIKIAIYIYSSKSQPQQPSDMGSRTTLACWIPMVLRLDKPRCQASYMVAPSPPIRPIDSTRPIVATHYMATSPCFSTSRITPGRKKLESH